MDSAVDRFDRWIRNEFVDLNTRLEEGYFEAGSDLVPGRPDLEEARRTLTADGTRLIARIAAAGRVPADAHERYRLLGAVGFHLAACRRHGTDGAGPGSGSGGGTGGPLTAAWSLANLLGASLGVAPRYVFAHQSLHNLSVRGALHTFTRLDDEHLFVTVNGLAALAYRRAAEALRVIPAMGVSNPMAGYLLENARSALDDVLGFNRRLAETLDADRFRLNIRPYFQPHRVGGTEYRGANAGDFAAINEIDLLLGLCRADDPFYQGVLAEKRPYVPPEDQAALSAAVTARPLLDAFVREASEGPVGPWLRRNAELFLDVCRAHGAAYAFHHHRLVRPFLEEPARPARHLPGERRGTVTAGGSPLDAVIAVLGRLSDLRAARTRPGTTGARAHLDRLRELLAAGP